jgi:hypothetical protein
MLLTKGAGDNITLVEGLKNDVQAMKSRCDILEKTVKDLQSICDTHRGILETFRQHIVNTQWRQGTLDMSYQGEAFEATR